MLIRELEQRTGLERATIRYYEKEGFITPHREENGYRTYSAEDRDMLLKIKLLRQLGIPLDKIRALQQGSADFSDALTDQIHVLEKQVRDATRAKEVCNDIRSAGITFSALDAEFYLIELTKTSSTEEKWKPQPVPEFSGSGPVHPWKRFFARTADLAILDIVILFVVVVVLRVRPLNGLIYTIIGLQIVVYLLWIPIEGLLLHYWGTTPGKWIFNIRVESVNGGHLSVSDAMHRAWNILCRGYGLTIPLYQYWRLYKSYRQYTDQGYLDWDYEWNGEFHFEYYYETGKKIGIACVAAAYLLTSGWYLSDSIKPTHRGEDLTVAQIAQNHNEFVDQLVEDASASMYLLEDGSWNSSNTVYGPNAILIGSQAVGNGRYHYELEDGFVRTITYEQSWTDVFYLSPIRASTIVTIKSMAFAQDWINLWNARSFEKALNNALKETSGHFKYHNLEIIWTTESTNCTCTGSYFFTENESLPSSVNLKMEIIIHDIP